MATWKTRSLKLLVLFLIISLAGLSSIYNYQQIVTYIFIPFALYVGFAINNFSFPSFRNTYSKCFLAILFLGILLTPISLDMEVAFQNIKKILGVYLVILITIELISYKYNILLKTFLISFVAAFIILALFLLFGNVANIDITSYIDRTQFDLNANTYSYFSYFANMALFYLIYLTKRKLYVILSFLCLFLGIYISFVTLSRSGIIFTFLIGILYWVFIFKSDNINPLSKFVVTCVLLGFGMSSIYNTYNNSYLKIRVNNSIESGDSREVLTENAINVFADHPFTGVGPGQFHFYSFNGSSFSHNSYTEIAANMGIVGLFLLLVLLARPLLKEFKRYFQTRDRPLSKLNILFFSSFLLINNIYVFYLTTFGMVFFTIIVMVQKNISPSLPLNEH